MESVSFAAKSRTGSIVVKKPDLATCSGSATTKEGQVILGNQAAVVKGAPHPKAGKLLIEFLLSKEGADIFVEGETIYTFREGYVVPPGARPYLLNLNQHKLLTRFFPYGQRNVSAVMLTVFEDLESIRT